MSDLMNAIIAAKLVGGGGGSGSGGDLFHLKIVETFTPDDPTDPDSGGTYSYALDKTGAEIDVAINAGKVLYCDGLQDAFDGVLVPSFSGFCYPVDWYEGTGTLKIVICLGNYDEGGVGHYTPRFSCNDATHYLTSSSERMAFDRNTISYFSSMSNGLIVGFVEPAGDAAFDVYLHAIDGSVTAFCEIVTDPETGDSRFYIDGWNLDPEINAPAFYGDGSATYTDALAFRLERALLQPRGIEDYNSSTHVLGQCFLKHIYNGAFSGFTL